MFMHIMLCCSSEIEERLYNMRPRCYWNKNIILSLDTNDLLLAYASSFTHSKP